MNHTTFSEILDAILRDLPGARATVFVDWDGEAVDGCGRFTDSTVQLLGAHWGIIYFAAKRAFARRAIGTPEVMVLRFSRQQIIIGRVTDEYLLITALSPEANLGCGLNRIELAVHRLREAM